MTQRKKSISKNEDKNIKNPANTMKSAQITDYGDAGVVQVMTAEKPSVSEDKLLIRVHAAGVNPADWKLRRGYFRDIAPLLFPVTMGGDFSGVIEDAGKNSPRFKKGDEVYGHAGVLVGGTGTFAQYVLAPVEHVALKPKTIDHRQAAALPLAGVSAYQALIEHMDLKQGQRILIHGGAGGIGNIAIQLAKHIGAYVITTVNTEDIAFAKELGADEAIDYTAQNFDEIITDCDAVLDVVGSETYRKSFKVLRKDGILVSLVETADERLMEEYEIMAILQATNPSTERLERLSELVEKGAIKAHIGKRYPIEEAGIALDHLENGHAHGKIVVDIA